MRARFLLSALVGASPSVVAAQTVASRSAPASPVPADTVAAWRYAPLAVGHEWAYRSHTGVEFLVRIDRDTLIGGQTYLREVTTQRYGPWDAGTATTAYVRFDTASAVVVAAPGSGLRWLDALRRSFAGGRFDRGPEATGSLGCAGGPCGVALAWGAVSVPFATATPYRLLVKSLRTHLDAGTSYAADVGLLSWTELALDMPSRITLDYAHVAGRTIGTRPTWVDAPGEVRAAPPTVRAQPQPFASRLHIDAPHVASGEAFVTDLLGRRLEAAAVVDGRADLDGSGLAAGVYVLRVCADGGTCTAQPVVRR